MPSIVEADLALIFMRVQDDRWLTTTEKVQKLWALFLDKEPLLTTEAKRKFSRFIINGIF